MSKRRLRPPTDPPVKVKKGRVAAAAAAAAFVGHHGFAVFMYHTWEWIGSHLGIALAIVVFSALTLAWKIGGSE